jgi:hypothetical protein
MNDKFSYEDQYDEYDDGEPALEEEWIPLRLLGVWLIRYTFPDGSALVTWAIQQPSGGFKIHIVG